MKIRLRDLFVLTTLVAVSAVPVYKAVQMLRRNDGDNGIVVVQPKLRTDVILGLQVPEGGSIEIEEEKDVNQ